MNTEHYMELAYQLALKGKGQVSPNPMVGAVIVKNNKVIAQGLHARCGGDHAEAAALQKAGVKAKGATLYVTLEPCSHYGRTPPCVQSIIKSGIAKVIIGMQDPNPLMNGKSIRLLKQSGIKVEVGCLSEKLVLMNEVFIKYMKERLPFVTAKTAQTIDGKIATSTGESQWITSAAAREYARSKRDEFDAIMVGANTIRKDNPGLNSQTKNKSLKKIIIDSHLTLSEKAKFFKATKPSDIIIATTSKAKQSRINLFKKMAVTVLVAPHKGENGWVDLTWVMNALAKLEISSVLIEGGGRLIGSALNEGLVDRVMIYVAPKILGDADGIDSISGRHVKKLADNIQLKEVSVKMLNQDLLIEGYVHRHR